jgi:(2Fe-2S) ferredoxin
LKEKSVSSETSHFYKQHVFFCTNQKEGGKKCCGAAEATEMFQYARQRAAVAGLPGQGIRISKSGCLGRCAEGPCVVVYPEGRWLTYRSREDVDAIVDALSTNISPNRLEI